MNADPLESTGYTAAPPKNGQGVKTGRRSQPRTVDV